MSGVSFAWNSVQWPRVIGRICRLQRRIYKARLMGPKKRVHWLQNKLIHSFDAKLLAVHLVTNEKKSLVLSGKTQRFPLSGNDKLFLAQNLSIDGKAFPTYKVCYSEGVSHVDAATQARTKYIAGACFTGCQIRHRKYPLTPYPKRFLPHGPEGVRGKGDALLVAKHQQGTTQGLYHVGGKDKKSKQGLSSLTPAGSSQSKKANTPWGKEGVNCNKETVSFLKSAREDTVFSQLCTVQQHDEPFKANNIFAICDRAKQALALLALEPEWEAIFEPNSFGFRPGRCAHDAIETIFLTLHQRTYKHVLCADIRECFHKIDHSHLLLKLDTFKLLENQISAWLKAGVMTEFANSDQQSYAASTQGKVISLLLVNIVLHGVENHLTKFVADLSFRPFSLIRQCQLHLPYPAWSCFYPTFQPVDALRFSYPLPRRGTGVFDVDTEKVEKGLFRKPSNGMNLKDTSQVNLHQANSENIKHRSRQKSTSVGDILTGYTSSALFGFTSKGYRKQTNLSGHHKHFEEVNRLSSVSQALGVQPLVSQIQGEHTKQPQLHPELCTPTGYKPEVACHLGCSARKDFSLQETVPFTIVRFANEFVIFHAQQPILDLCLVEVQKWLADAGLEIAKKKCVIKDCRQSFVFLGFNIIQIQRNLLARRSRPGLTPSGSRKSKETYNPKDTKYGRSVKHSSMLRPLPLRGTGVQPPVLQSMYPEGVRRRVAQVQGAIKVARSIQSCEAYKSEYKVKITPSRQACFAYLDKVRHIIKKNRQVSTYNLILKLRPVTIEWANYYRFCDCSVIFRKMGNLVFQMLRHWVFRRHSRENRFSIKEKYWPSGRIYQFDHVYHKNNWVLCGKSYTQGGILTENYLPHMSWFQSRKFVKIQGEKSFYDSDSLYWAERNNNKSTPKNFTELFQKQNGECVLCNYYLDTFV